MRELVSARGLKEVLPARGRVLIIPHDYPDPDALASAAALHLLLDRAYHVRSSILFSGMVNRPENQELLRHFRYHWRRLQDFQPPSKRVAAIFLDVWPGSGNVTIAPWIRPIGVIDHHPPPTRNPPSDWFIEVRPGIGATATLLHEKLRAAGVIPPPWLAAILAYAIETETLAFTRPSTSNDRAAYTELITRANLRIIGAIRNAPLPQRHVNQLREALANARLHANAAWSHLSAEASPEVVAEVSDLLLRLERVSWSFCTGIQGDVLWVSVRGERRDAQCGRIVREALQNGGQGGGHDRMAAGYVSLRGLDDTQRQERVRQLQISLLRRMIPRKLPSDPDDHEGVGRSIAEWGR